MRDPGGQSGSALVEAAILFPVLILILYWSIARPAGIVLGFSQKRDILNADAVSRLAFPVYQRRAGGTAVLFTRMIFDFMLDRSARTERLSI